jgi:integrase
MPPRPQPPRLWLRPARPGRPPTWLILDRGRQIATGCNEDDREAAHRSLSEYLVAKWEPGSKRAAEHVQVADAITLYLRDVAPSHAQPKETADRMKQIFKFFGDKRASQINGSLCRQYLRQRGSAPAARRELEDFRAALHYFHREGFLRERIAVWMPPKAPSRARWLTRSEAALLVRTAWRRPGLRRVARFCLVALYTGARAGRICSAALVPSKDRGYIDLDQGLFIPQPGRIETNKRQPSVRLPRRLLAHLRRWKKKGQRYVVEWNGKPVARMDFGFREAVKASGLDGVSAHVLKHTAITWLLQRGAPIWDVAGYTGTSPQTIARVYGHHSTDHMAGALAALDRPGGIPRQQNANESRERNVTQRARNGQKIKENQRPVAR